MRRARWTRAVTLVAVVGAGLVLAACSGSDEAGPIPGSPRATSAVDTPVMADVVAATTATRTARVEFTFAGGTATPVVQTRVVGELDFETGSGTSVAESAGSTIELRVDGDRTFLSAKGTALTRLVPPGVEWVEAPTTELVERGVMSVDADVSWAPVLLLDGAVGIERGDVDGEWTFGVDPQLVRDSLTPAQLRAVRNTLGDLLADEVTMTGTVVLDDAGRVMRLVLRARIDGPRETDDGVIELTLVASGYDDPVTVERPAPELVVTTEEAPELLEQLSGPGPGY